MSNLSRDFSDLPRDLAEEVLSKVPVTSMRRVRSTCKKWNTLSRSRSFKEKHLGVQAKLATKKREFMVVMMIDYKVDLMSVNLDGELCMKRQGTLVTPDASDQTYVRQVIHCDGLLLCVLKDNPRVLVFNPYCGQPRWFPPITDYSPYINEYSYALGYSNNSIAKSHKILSFAMVAYGDPKIVEFKIYDFNSSSWRVLDFTPDWYIYSYSHSHSHGVSLKGNTYWFAHAGYPETLSQGVDRGFLLCFDFTREAFGPRLPLPFGWWYKDTVSLSNARDDQLAVLFQREDTLQMEIWVTTKVEPNTVSWGTKLRKLTASIKFMFCYCGPSFFIDEEKKVVMVFDKSKDRMSTRNAAYIIGEDGSFLKEVDLGESPNKDLAPLVCSYLPSSVLLK